MIKYLRNKKLSIPILAIVLLIIISIVFIVKESKEEEKGLELAISIIAPASLSILDGPKEIKRPEIKLINKTEEWKSLEQRLTFSPANPGLPEIDFNSQSVVVVFGGKKEKGGNNLEIKDVKIRDKTVNVKAILTTPGKDCLATPHFTSPLAIAEISKFAGQATLVIEEKQKDCPADKKLHSPLPL